MLDIIKQFAQQALVEQFGKVGGDTTAQSQAGANGVMDLIQNQLSSGNVGAITELLSGKGNGGDMLSQIQNVLGGALQQNGLSAEEAASKAQQSAPDLINGLKDKFLSQDKADAGFDLNQLQGLIGGDAGNLLNVVKGFL